MNWTLGGPIDMSARYVNSEDTPEAMQTKREDPKMASPQLSF